MPKPKRGEVGARLTLDDLRDHDAPELTVHAVAADGSVIASAPVDDDGTFAIKSDAVTKARQIRIGVSGVDPADTAATVTIPTATFAKLVERGEINLGARDWGRLITVKRCIDASLRRCRLLPIPIPPIIVDPILGQPLPPWWPPVPPPPPIRICAPICEGTVEVYRRTCCCRPPVFDPPIATPEIPFDPPIPVPDPIPDPWPGPWPDPVPPGPGPDPLPYEVAERFLVDGTLDVAKLNAERDQLALRRLTGIERHEYLVARPYLWCTCSGATKVGEGFVGEGGSIHVCWREPLRLLGPNCHDEFAFVVKQNIGGATITIYNGVATGQWFEMGDDIDLTTFNPLAIGCGTPEFPPDPGGNYVVLQDLGGTESHRLRTPLPDGPDSVATPGANDGLLDLGVDHALGGTVHLRYHFSAGMQAMGARYYRVQVASANGIGDPVGSWATVDAPAWKTWASVGGSIQKGSHALGPTTVGAEPDLFEIPYETGAPLGANEEWQDGQFHAVLDTTGLATGRHLVRIEVFDAAGNRLEPGADPFTYLRWSDPITTTPVGFGALTHLIWVDNRPVSADIIDITGPGTTMGDCKFFTGGAGDLVNVSYSAFHPQLGPPSFLHDYSLVISRGINGGAVSSFGSSVPANPGNHAVSIGTLLGTEEKCSFAVNLHVRARIHNGFGRLSGLDRHDVAAFAAEQVS